MGYSHVRENFVKVWGGGLEPATHSSPRQITFMIKSQPRLFSSEWDIYNHTFQFLLLKSYLSLTPQMRPNFANRPQVNYSGACANCFISGWSFNHFCLLWHQSSTVGLNQSVPELPSPENDPTRTTIAPFFIS
jgi:hypothetical protein